MLVLFFRCSFVGICRFKKCEVLSDTRKREMLLAIYCCALHDGSLLPLLLLIEMNALVLIVGDVVFAQLLIDKRGLDFGCFSPKILKRY